MKKLLMWDYNMYYLELLFCYRSESVMPQTYNETKLGIEAMVFIKFYIGDMILESCCFTSHLLVILFQ